MADDLIPFDGDVEAEYSDGYIHSQTVLNDASLFEPETRNTFYDIVNFLPVAEHGPMVRFAVYFNNARYDLDWTDKPDSARPIRFKYLESDDSGPRAGETRLMKVGFGWQFTDSNGKNQQFVEELKY